MLRAIVHQVLETGPTVIPRRGAQRECVRETGMKRDEVVIAPICFPQHRLEHQWCDIAINDGVAVGRLVHADQECLGAGCAGRRDDGDGYADLIRHRVGEDLAGGHGVARPPREDQLDRALRKILRLGCQRGGGDGDNCGQCRNDSVCVHALLLGYCSAHQIPTRLSPPARARP